MNTVTDQQLLRDYAERRSESAFSELVRRHVDLVYSAALRMVHDAHLAQDVTQAVFVVLAKNARALADHPVLSGWLHRTALNLAAKNIRTDVRRRAREQEAIAMNALLAAESDAPWENIAPILDTSLGELAEPDRDALLLRFFEKKSAHEMAQVLGISNEAAQKRVSRAVERLRELFAKRGVTAGASGLAAIITANAVQAAPAGLAGAISATALAGASVAATTTVATTAKLIAMTTFQKSLIAATLAILAAGAMYEASRNPPPTELPRSSWTDAGFATPEATLKTHGWAVVTGNHEKFAQTLSITPGARKALEDSLAKMASESTDPDRTRLLQEASENKLAVEDGILMPLMAQNQKNSFTGFRILSRKKLSDDEMLLDVEIQTASAPASAQLLKFQRFGQDWKMVLDENSVK